MLGAARALIGLDSSITGALIGFAALILSLATLTWTITATRKSTTNAETQTLKQDLDELRGQVIQTGRELDECKQGRAELQKQNFELMLEVHQLSKRGVT